VLKLYFADSGNSLRVLMVLEECALPYGAHKLDLSKGEQKDPQFLRVNPFGAVPVLHDPQGPDGEPVLLSQSAAIILYLAEKAGKLIPSSAARKLKMMQWLMMAASDAGPANTLLLYMSNRVPDLSAASRAFLTDRFVNLMRVVEAHLAASKYGFLAEEISLADFALLPVVRMRRSLLEEIGGFAHLFNWADGLLERSAVRRALAVCDARDIRPTKDRQR
jgi:GST-like protein